MDGKKRRIQKVFVGVTVIGLLFAAGCGSSRKMTAQTSGEKIFGADKAFSVAKESNASLNAKDALAIAEGKLAKAKDAFANKNYEEAADLADQAVVDAEYAKARATTQKNLEIAEGIKKDTNDLRQEIERISK